MSLQKTFQKLNIKCTPKGVAVGKETGREDRQTKFLKYTLKLNRY